MRIFKKMPTFVLRKCPVAYLAIEFFRKQQSI